MLPEWVSNLKSLSTISSEPGGGPVTPIEVWASPWASLWVCSAVLWAGKGHHVTFHVGTLKHRKVSTLVQRYRVCPTARQGLFSAKAAGFHVLLDAFHDSKPVLAIPFSLEAPREDHQPL